MKKFAITLIFSIILSTSLFSSPWSGGYKVSLSGYHTDAITQSEHVDLHLIYSPLLTRNSAITLHGGYAFSSLFYPVTHSLTAGLSYGHMIAQNHILESILIRDSSLWAHLDISIMRVFSSPHSTYINFSLSPFSLFFGDKFITVGSIILTYNIDIQELDWGVKLLEVTMYLW